MSWFLGRLLNEPEKSKRDEDEDNDSEDEDEDEEELLKSGIHEDFSQLKQTFTKHLFGVASFISGETESSISLEDKNFKKRNASPNIPTESISNQHFHGELKDTLRTNDEIENEKHEDSDVQNTSSIENIHQASSSQASSSEVRSEDQSKNQAAENSKVISNDQPIGQSTELSNDESNNQSSEKSKILLNIQPIGQITDESIEISSKESNNQTLEKSKDTSNIQSLGQITEDFIGDSSNDPPKDLSKDSSYDPSKDVSKDLSKDSSNDLPKDPSTVQTEDQNESKAQFSGMQSDLAELSISMASSFSKFSSALFSVSNTNHPSTNSHNTKWFASPASHASSTDIEKEVNMSKNKNLTPQSSLLSLSSSIAHPSSTFPSIPSEESSDSSELNQDVQGRNFHETSDSADSSCVEQSFNAVNEKDALLNAAKDDLTAITKTFTKSIGGISKFASNFLSFNVENHSKKDSEEDDEDGDEEEEEEEEEDDNDVALIGLSDDIVAFVSTITSHPETWVDFPLAKPSPSKKFEDGEIEDDDEDDDDDDEAFDLSVIQEAHLDAMEERVPRLSSLRLHLSPTFMSESKFILIYFVLLHSKLSKEEASLLSTPQVIKARSKVLEALKHESENKNKNKEDEKNDNSNDDNNKNKSAYENEELENKYDVELKLTAEIELDSNISPSSSSMFNVMSNTEKRDDVNLNQMSLPPLLSSSSSSSSSASSSSSSSASSSSSSASSSSSSFSSTSNNENEKKVEIKEDVMKNKIDENKNEIDADDWLDDESIGHEDKNKNKEEGEDEDEEDVDESSWIHVDKE